MIPLRQYDRRSVHERVAVYLHRQSDGLAEVSSRDALELAHQWYHARRPERLANTLSSIPHFMALYQGESQYKVLGWWRDLSKEYDLESAYRRGLELWRHQPHDQFQENMVMARVSRLMEAVGRWEGAQAMEQERLLAALEQGNQIDEAGARRRLGWLLQLQGKHSEAHEELTRSLALYEELNDRGGLSLAIGHLGGLYYRGAEYDRALGCFLRQEAMCHERDDRSGLSIAINNVGVVYWHLGAYDRALECHRKHETICRVLGDRIGLGSAMGNMGRVHQKRAEYDRALERYRQQEEICRELGDRSGLSQAIGNMGNVFSHRGEYDRALECFRQQEAICSSLGDHNGLSVAIGNIGRLHHYRGDHEYALECYLKQEEIYTELGNRNGIADAIGNIGVVYHDRGEYGRALESFQRQEAISVELGDRGGRSRAIGNSGAIYQELGEFDRALEYYRQWETICTELNDRRGRAIAIGHLGNLFRESGKFDLALEHTFIALEESRAIGVPEDEVGWLRVLGGALLDLTEVSPAAEMPAYLPHYLPEAVPAQWQSHAVAAAAKSIIDSLRIAGEIGLNRDMFAVDVLRARAYAAEGNNDAALEHLSGLLLDTVGDDQKAELHFWLWKLGRNKDQPKKSSRLRPSAFHAVESLRLFRHLVTKSPKHEYRKRIDVLTTAFGDVEDL